ncbi:hypothetical protein CXQ85_001913 [Candidozyma haemuli]|uniref:rRNA methyltransferase 2, mitochondrial n=1 Tax=Candidozyma haemuli TaxID=45357 RepID=A0A2V1AS68_9ASCO|nr:hypothetical protein CXQ85_001913 [[Candida] haemuloni]PVH20133.1 hypothetical protein CXQ85_001913 [[Candida] haemuloni]
MIPRDIRWRGILYPRLSVLLHRGYASARLTRQEKIDGSNHLSRSKLHQLDTKFNLFNENVTKMVDLGYSPGNWLIYAREALSRIHEIEPEKIYQKCTLVGLDIIIGNHPAGTFTTQGNILSKLAHRNVISLLKEHAYKRLVVQNGLLDDLLPEQDAKDPTFESEMARISDIFDDLSLKDKTLESILSLQDYQADLITSDLSSAFLQDKGFFNNTTTRPFIRSSTNSELRRNVTDPLKASIDTAEAALLLCCEALAKGGNFVIRLARIDLADPEIDLLEERLKRVFKHVQRWKPEGSTKSNFSVISELYFVCKDKQDHLADKYNVFDVKR